MRAFAGLVAVACLVGCDEAAEHVEMPDWSLALEQVAVDGWISANSAAARASDGTFFVAVHAPDVEVRIGEETLEGSQVVRVGADGAVLELVAADEANGYSSGPTRLRTDDLGNTVVLWGESSLAAYDTGLHRKWVLPFESNWLTLFDVSALGAIAVITRDDVASTATIHFLNPDGTTAWETTQAQILSVRFAANGDLFVFGAGHRWRYDSTGDIVDDIRVTSGTTFADATGAWLYARSTSESSEVDRYDSRGELVWSRTYPYSLWLDHILVSTTGDILVHADVFTESPVLLVIDPATGNHRQLDSGCASLRLVDVDVAHCYGFGTHGLSQFAIQQ